MIRIGGRYETGIIGFLPDARRGQRLSVLRNANDAKPVVQRVYVSVEGDRLDVLSYRFYARSDYWWVIADANPDLLLPDPLPAGLRLRIPNAPNRL